MTDREKVIKGLECCVNLNGLALDHDCMKCPYKGTYGTCASIIPLMEDALQLLKEQEPRVLTLEEVKRLQSLRDGAVWLESGSGVVFPVLPEMSLPNITYFVAIPFNAYRSWVENEYYGKTWRCWSARPSDEVREAVPWTE